jgi:hypothetical protein
MRKKQESRTPRRGVGSLLTRSVALLFALLAVVASAPQAAAAPAPPGPGGCHVSITNMYKPTSTTVRATFAMSCSNTTPMSSWTYGEIQRDGNAARVGNTLTCSVVSRCALTMTISDVAGSQKYWFYVKAWVSGWTVAQNNTLTYITTRYF